MKLGVNVDHIAVLKAAREINSPDVLQAIWVAQSAGADQITIHLREDRRHIDDYDARRIVENSPLPVNIECSMDSEILRIVTDLKPYRVTLVPEKIEEVTTEGGLAVAKMQGLIKQSIDQLKQNEIKVSFFVEPDSESIKLSKELGADMIEIHTGLYAHICMMLFGNLSRTPYSIKSLEKPRAELENMLENELMRIRNATDLANSIGLAVAAGHGLNLQNLDEIVKIDGIEELNIGQSIVARSLFVGLDRAIKDVVNIIR